MTIQTFTLYSPNAPKPNQKLLLDQEHPFQPIKHYYFVYESDYLLIYREELKTNLKTGEKKLLANQTEIPLAGIGWLIDAIEQKFFKSPEEGGLPANKTSYAGEVAGEHLHVMRAVTAGCDYPGYDITNLDRQSYILTSCKQSASFADPWLFEHGLMDFLKEVANQYERGQL